MSTFQIAVGLLLVCHIYYLTDVIRSTFKQPVNKIVWVLVIILLPILGAILYIFFGRRQKSVEEE